MQNVMMLVDLQWLLFARSACLRRKRRIFGSGMKAVDAESRLWMI